MIISIFKKEFIAGVVFSLLIVDIFLIMKFQHYYQFNFFFISFVKFVLFIFKHVQYSKYSKKNLLTSMRISFVKIKIMI